MPRPTRERPYDPAHVPEWEQQVADQFQALRQALLPLREMAQRRWASFHKVDAARQARYLQETRALEAVPEAASGLYLAQQQLNEAQHQAALAAESGAGLTDARRELQALAPYRHMLDVLLSVLDFAGNAPVTEAQQAQARRIGKWQAHADALQARYPGGLPAAEAPAPRHFYEPHRRDEPCVPVYLPARPPQP